MFKIVIALAALVYFANAVGVVPLDLGRSLSEISSRKVPSTSTYYRLPTDTVPIRYEVTLTTDIDQGIFNFTGNVIIHLKAVSNVNRIVIHQRQLTIDAVSLILLDDQYGELGNPIELKPWEYNTTTEFLTISLSSGTLMTSHIYKLEIDYHGTLRGTKAGKSQKDAGFYRSSYTNAHGDLKWLATTQFEATDARHGFPCYDEPALKAEFKIVIKHGLNYTAISNMPQIDSVKDGVRKKTTFAISPVMSTYLIAFVISDFDYVSNLNAPEVGKVMHRVFGTPARKDQLNFTLEAGVKMLDALDTYLGVNYYDNINKMDQIGIPDFAAGAMENWGLVTYTESAFYYSSASPFNQKDRISKIVAHEFAHQWFGNLVSPEWWNYIWLNEGFATVFEYLIPNSVYPEYQALDYFTIQVCQRVLVTDSVSDIRPMTFDAYSPSEISALFDRIAYDKSGCVITMFMRALGEDVFKAGLNKYLNDRRGQAANSEHLFTALQTHARESGAIPSAMTINSVFGQWSTQPGYPILTVTFNSKNKSITLQQEAFLIDSHTDENELSWTIPYNFITDLELTTTANTNTTPHGWLNTKTHTLNPTATRNWTAANWILFNKKQTGYYRVNYDTNNWEAIINYVAKSEDARKIHYLNRAQLISDAMNIARANRLSYSIPLKLVQTMMPHETSYFTWIPFINDFNYLEQTMFETSTYSKLLKLAIEVGTPAYNHYTLNEKVTDLYYDTMTRYNLINFMCKVGFSGCLEDTTSALNSYLANNLTVSSYLKTAILQNGLRNANRTIFLQVWKLIMLNANHVDRSTFISGLGLTNSHENIHHLLDSVLTTNNETFADTSINYSVLERSILLATIASNKVSGLKHVLGILKTEATKVKDIFGNDVVVVFSILASRTSSAETLKQLKELMTIYKANDVDSRFGGYATIAQQNVAWNARVGRNVKDPLDTIYPDDPDTASSIFISSVLVIASLMFTRFMV